MTPAGGTISLLVGAVLLRLTFTDTYRRYVRPEMGLWLTIAGVAVILLGALTLARALRSADGAGLVHGHDHDEHDHDEHGVGVGWLLLAPIAALLLVAPPTLGSYGVGRAATVDVRAGKAVFHPLSRRGAPVEMSLLEYDQRAFDHHGASFHDVPVKLTGFIAGAETSGFKLARYQIACCAADAIPAVVQVVGTAGAAPTRDQWVTVTGTFQRGGGDFARLAATTVTEIAAPEDPYE